MWAEWGKTTFVAAFAGPIFWACVRTPPPERDGAALTAAIARFDRPIGMIEAQLGDQPFVMGDALTLADTVIGHLLYRYFTIPIPRRGRRLAAYYARLAERPAYREHVMVSYDALRAGGLMEADFVIVGSGSAGSALAYRLGEAGHSVLVLEYGGSDWGPFIQMPAALAWPMSMARYDWGFSPSPSRISAGAASPARAARCWGARPRSTAWSSCAATPATSTPGPRWAPTAGPSPTCCPTSSAWRPGTGRRRRPGAAPTGRCT